MMQHTTPQANAPWWKFGHVWLILSGPVVVVVASFITLYLAVTRPDPLVAEDYYRQGIDINKTLDKEANAANAANAASLAPALQARNHAATGVVPKPSVSPQP